MVNGTIAFSFCFFAKAFKCLYSLYATAKDDKSYLKSRRRYFLKLQRAGKLLAAAFTFEDK